MRPNEKYPHLIADLIGVSYDDIFWYLVDQGDRWVEINWAGDIPHRVAMRKAIRYTPQFWSWFVEKWERLDKSIHAAFDKEDATGTIYFCEKAGVWVPLENAWEKYKEIHRAEFIKGDVPQNVVNEYLSRIHPQILTA